MLNLEEIQGVSKSSTDGKKIIIDATLKYFNILKEQRYQFILNFAQSLRSRQSEISCSKLIEYLKPISQSSHIVIQKKEYESLEQQIMHILKEAINQFIYKKRQPTEDPYENIAQRNQRYIELSSQKAIKAMTYATIINNLISIDILSIFLKQNHRFRQNCLVNANYWPMNILTSLIPLSLELLERLSKYYPGVERFLNFDIDKRIQGIVEIFALIKLSVRLSNIKRMNKKDVEEYLRTKVLKLKMRQALNQKSINRPGTFNFCELIIFSQQREKDFFLLKDQVEVLQRFNEIKNQRHQQNEKILDLKFTYKVSFKSIFQILSKISEDKELYSQFFEKEQDVLTIGLQITLEYDFPAYKTLFEGVNKCHLQRYNTSYVPIQAALICPRKVKSQFLNTALQQYLTIQKIKYSIAKQYQRSPRPILYITKLQISYNKLKNQPQEHEDDLILTFMIGMVKENVKFVDSYQGRVSQSYYFQWIKEKLQDTIGIHPFYVVIQSSAFKREFSNSGLRRLRNYIMKRHQSPFNIDENSFLSFHVLRKRVQLMQLFAFVSSKLTRANFYDRATQYGLKILSR